jgi:hypothetical protein
MVANQAVNALSLVSGLTSAAMVTAVDDGSMTACHAGECASAGAKKPAHAMQGRADQGQAVGLA